MFITCDQIQNFITNKTAYSRSEKKVKTFVSYIKDFLRVFLRIMESIPADSLNVIILNIKMHFYIYLSAYSQVFVKSRLDTQLPMYMIE